MNMLKLKNLHTFRDHTGTFRAYVRRAGSKTIPISGKLGSSQFMAEYRRALRSAKAPPEHRDLPIGSGVYFIKAGNCIKIGKTNNLRSRFTGLQTGAPEELNLVLFVGGGRDLEKSLHRKFRHLRMKGEWFRAEPELLAHIDVLRMEDEQ